MVLCLMKQCGHTFIFFSKATVFVFFSKATSWLCSKFQVFSCVSDYSAKAADGSDTVCGGRRVGDKDPVCWGYRKVVFPKIMLPPKSSIKK